MADARDSKSRILHWVCGFDSHLRHSFLFSAGTLNPLHNRATHFAEHTAPDLSALIEDIHQRGLDEKILVVAVGEFGRTPRVTSANGCLGRDHWPQAQSALIAGGELRMGQVAGATNSKAEYPAERPLHPQDLLATIYHHLGINHRHEFPDFSGHPIPVLFYGEPIRELV